MLIHRCCIGISFVGIASISQALLPLCSWEIASRVARCCSDGALALAGLLEEVGPLKLTGVVGLPVHGDSIECVLESLAGAGVHHAGLRDVSTSGRQGQETCLDASRILVDICDESNLRSVPYQSCSSNGS